MKQLNIWIAACAVVLLSGCDFLNQDNKSNISSSDYYGSDKGFESLYNAAFSSLRTIYGGDPWLFSSGTDLFATGRTSVNPVGLYGASFTAADADVQTFYVEHYKAISLTNEVIYWANEGAGRERMADEARGLRALYYLNLAQQFGGVPLTIERQAKPIKNMPRKTATEIYSFVIDELKALAGTSALEDKASAGTGHFDKRTANHYLAKAYLCRGYLTNDANDFTAAKTAADAAIAGTALTTPFATLFSNAGETNDEIVFSIVYSTATTQSKTDGNKQMAHFCDYLDGQEKGHKYTSSTLTPTLWMHEVFAANTTNPAADERYEATFMTELRQSYWDYYDNSKKDISTVTYYYCPSWLLPDTANWRAALPSHAQTQIVEMTPTGANIGGISTTYEAKMKEDVYGVASFRKFDDIENGKENFSTTSSMRDIILARLGETYLIAAEACIKAGNTTDALTYVNAVRTRAHATAATAAEMNIDYILNERARELAGEYHRWEDLARTQKLSEYALAHNPDITSALDAHFLLRPIPTAAIELNDALTQNPNY